MRTLLLVLGLALLCSADVSGQEVRAGSLYCSDLDSVILGSEIRRERGSREFRNWLDSQGDRCTLASGGEAVASFRTAGEHRGAQIIRIQGRAWDRPQYLFREDLWIPKG